MRGVLMDRLWSGWTLLAPSGDGLLPNDVFVQPGVHEVIRRSSRFESNNMEEVQLV